jgi:hypothetical protein
MCEQEERQFAARNLAKALYIRLVGSSQCMAPCVGEQQTTLLTAQPEELAAAAEQIRGYTAAWA